jgi:molecular chaperone GrpE
MTEEANNQAEEIKENKGVPIKVKHIRPEAEEPVRVTDKRFWVNESKDGIEEAGPESATEAVAEETKPSYVMELEKKLVDTEKKLDEVVASYRQHKAESTAEIQKIRQRIQNAHNRRLIQANVEMAKKFLPVLENLERALTASADTTSQEPLQEGIRLICQQFKGALTDLGVESLEVLGKPFNPEVAEAIEMVPVFEEKQDHEIVEIVSKGYRLGEALVRPARVKVGKYVEIKGEA